MEYKVDHIPKSTPFNRRPALSMVATTITIHNTGNPSSTAANERSWLTNAGNNRTASYHIVVDERQAIECLPLNEVGWHAGDGSGASSGNRTSIGIEICESGDYTKTLDNAADLVAKMLRERGWGVDRLRRHWDWSGKICPRLMYDGGKWTGWTQFKQMVAAKLEEDEAMTDTERKQFEAMGKKVNELESAVTTLTMQLAATKEAIPAPKWFVTEFEREGQPSVLERMSDPVGTVDFWRSLAVSLRMQGLGKGAE